MKHIAVILLLIVSQAGYAQTSWAGLKKDSLTALLQSKLTRALVVYENGNKVFEYGKVHQSYEIFSMRKSLVSLLYGIYVKEGKIDLDATLEQLAVDDKEGLTASEKQAKIIDLLRARSGVYHAAAYETPGMIKNRPARGLYKPGEHWYYNNWDFNALTTIFEKSANQTVFVAFDEKIAQPIGMEDFMVTNQQYFLDSMSDHKATRWFMSASDLSKLGLLLMNNGMWAGKRIIDAAWIKTSTAPFSDLGVLGGYGYCWWAALNGNHFPYVTLPDGTFSARGTGEQILLVVPEKKIVIVHLTEVKDPKDPMMKVTETGKILKYIVE